MSLIADALKRAQEQRAGAAPDPGARRLLTPSGPLKVRAGRRRDLPRSLAVAGFGLASSIVVFGLAVVLSPRAEIRASTAYAATPGPAVRGAEELVDPATLEPADVRLPDAGGAGEGGGFPAYGGAGESGEAGGWSEGPAEPAWWPDPAGRPRGCRTARSSFPAW